MEAISKWLKEAQVSTSDESDEGLTNIAHFVMVTFAPAVLGIPANNRMHETICTPQKSQKSQFQTHNQTKY